MSILEILGEPIVLSVIIGVIGAISRILVQTINQDEEKRSVNVLASLLGLGAIGGWLAYLIAGYVPIAIWALGFVAPDVVENLANAYSPSE